MAYTPTIWVNDSAPFINAGNLNKIEQGISDAVDSIDALGVTVDSLADSANINFLQSGTDAVSRTVSAKLADVVSVKDFGATGDGVSDDAAAIQAAIDTGKSIFFPKGTYVVGATITTSMLHRGQQLKGDGSDQTVIQGSAEAGAVIRLKGSYQGIFDLTISSTGARAAATNASGYGLHIEPDDAPSNASTLQGYLYNLEVDNIVIAGQPSTGCYIGGGIINGSTFDRLRIFSNRGHGFHLERGSQHRVNADASIGLCHLNHCNIFGNSGNGVALGNPLDTTTTQTIRVQIDNVDVGDNALLSGVRFDAYQIWIAGTGVQIATSYTSDSQVVPTTGGVYVQGTNNRIVNLRTNDVDPAINVGDNGASLRTAGIYIDGLNVLTTSIADLDPAVVVDGNASDVFITSAYEANITTVASRSVTGLSVAPDEVMLNATANSTVNNTTTKAPISGLGYSVAAGEVLVFDLVLHYVAGGTGGDINVGFDFPLSAQVRWCTVDGRRTNTAGTIVDQTVNVSSANTISVIADTSERILHLVGYVRNLGAAEGLFRPTFAQATAQPHDLTVNSPFSYLHVRKIKPLAA